MSRKLGASVKKMTNIVRRVHRSKSSLVVGYVASLIFRLKPQNLPVGFISCATSDAQCLGYKFMQKPLACDFATTGINQSYMRLEMPPNQLGFPFVSPGGLSLNPFSVCCQTRELP